MPLRPLRHRARRAREIAAGRSVRELFDQHGQMVYALCRLNLRDRLDAEDATQQTFLAAYRSLLGGRGPEHPPAWLAAIARNECARLRKGRVSTVPIDELEGSGDDVANEVEQRAEIEVLATALSELPPSQRDAVVLREFYGLSYAEVSSVLGVSSPAVESLLFKGRKRLQEKLGVFRVASGLMLSDTVRDALVQVVPGFGGAAASGFTVPAAAKLAAVAVVVTGGGVAVVDTVHHEPTRQPTSVASPQRTTRATAPPRRAEAPLATKRAPHTATRSVVAAHADDQRHRRRAAANSASPAPNAHRVQPVRTQERGKDERQRQSEDDERARRDDDVTTADEADANAEEPLEEAVEEPEETVDEPERAETADEADHDPDAEDVRDD